MMHFPIALLQHVADTVHKVHVAAPDTIQRVRLVGPVEIVPHGIDFNALLMTFATVVLVVITYISYRRAQALNEEVANLQKGREKDRIRSVRARARGVAYALRRQLQSWLDEAPETVHDIVNKYTSLDDTPLRDGLVQAGTTLQTQTGCTEWIKAHTGEHLDRAEQRVQQLLQDAPELEEGTADNIRKAFVRFYSAMRWMAQVTAAAEVNDVEVPMASVAKAYHDLYFCVRPLDEVIGKELLSVVV
jgi:exonuclease VII small subunit